MTKEQKELLLTDLSARLPYNVKCTYYDKCVDEEDEGTITGMQNGTYFVIDGGCIDVENVKPYLFPLSSMTEEQWMDTPYANLNNFTFDSFKCGCSTLAFETYEVNLNYVVEFINWCYKNHFDCRGLIPMGLAIDATGKNIY